MKKDSLKRPSVFSSSAESLTSMEDSYLETLTTQEQLYENIRLHKEIIQSVKTQPLSLSKKYKIVTKAKQYVAHHEGVLQERFEKSGNTKDLLARFKLMLAHKLKHLKREIYNYSALLIPWEIRIKEIESRFGSVVASYFIFLRWLFWVNTIICIVFLIFVIIPELLCSDPNTTDERKVMLPEERNKALNFITVWDFEGYLRYSPLFYGYYSDSSGAVRFGYHLPIAYFLAGLFVYIYSFAATLRKMAENSRTAKLSSKDDECVFSWKLFTGWDFMIGHSETAQNRIASVVLGFKEALLEEAEKQKDNKNWKVMLLRIFVNLNVLLLLFLSAYAVIFVVERSDNIQDNSWWARNEITMVMSFISIVFPMLFEILGLLEYYHPRMQLRLQLARIMILNLLNLYSLIWALFGKINGMTKELDSFKEHKNESLTTLFSTAMSEYPTTESMSFQSTSLDTALIASTVIFTLASAATTLMPSNKSEIGGVTTTEFLDTTQFTSPDSTASEPTEHYDYTNYDYFERADVLREQQEMYKDVIIDHNHHDLSLPDDMDFGEENSTATEKYFSSTVNSSTPDYNSSSDSIEVSSSTYEPGMRTSESSDFKSTMSPYFSTNSKLEEDLPSSSIPLYSTTHENYRFGFETQATPPPNNFMKNTASENSVQEKPHTVKRKNLTASDCLKLRKLCWETMFGQELVKLTVMDLLLTVITILLIDFFRALFVRFMNNCWCWDLEKRFPKYGDFKIAENILHLVNNQGLVWMGMFFSPGLAILNLIKLAIIMYVRSWAVLTCNVPHEVIFRASRSNNFYLTLLLTMLFLCVLPVSYAIVWLEPSWHCGPFSDNERIYYLFTDTIKSIIHPSLHKFLHYIVSPAAIIPLLLLLVLFIYYLISLTGALRAANVDLKEQLHKERTEERKKMMKLMEDKLLDAQYSSKLSDRWKKLLTVSNKPGAMVSTCEVLAEESAERKKLLLAKAMKNILRKKYSHDDDHGPRAVKIESVEAKKEGEEITMDRKKLALARAMKNILKKKQAEKEKEKLAAEAQLASQSQVPEKPAETDVEEIQDLDDYDKPSGDTLDKDNNQSSETLEMKADEPEIDEINKIPDEK